MKDLILFGAYDRFNFGDMLMPMALSRYIERNHPKVLDDYRFRFASLSASDMSNRDCLPTEAIMSVCATASEDATLIVTGGEVFGVQRAALFMHNSRSDAEHAENEFLLKNRPEEFRKRLIADIGDIWEYPYLPPKSCLPQGGRIMYNAIGGNISAEKFAEQDIRWNRVADASYLSIRDHRLDGALSKHGKPAFTSPCAVSLLAEGYFDDLDGGPIPSDDPYFVFQCVYSGSGIDFDQMAENLRRFSEATGLRPFLVPLAYASNHYDDRALLAIKERLGDIAMMDEKGTLSSILTTFRHARCYIGTSLHGTITAMAYGIPYFPFKRAITKLGGYLDCWSKTDGLALLNQVRKPADACNVPWERTDALSEALKRNATAMSQRASANIDKMVARLS